MIDYESQVFRIALERIVATQSLDKARAIAEAALAPLPEFLKKETA